MLEEAADTIKRAGVSFVDYYPLDAAMSTVSGRESGKLFAMIMVNTAFDFDPHRQGLAYAGVEAKKLFKETGDRAKAIALQSRLSYLHELAHVTDKIVGGRLTKTFMDAVMLETGTNEGKIKGFLVEHVSRYALASPSEGMAEAMSKYINEGKLPGALDEWAHEATQQIAKIRAKKKTTDAEPEYDIHHFTPYRLPKSDEPWPK